MADVQWRTRQLSGGKVRLFGELPLGCGHSVKESAQVRNDTRSLARGQDTLRAMLKDLAREHAKGCK